MLQFNILLMICTDSKFLYKYFVKLKIIYEKRLMINVMNFVIYTENVKSLKFNESTKTTIQLISWRKSKYHRFWKFWSIVIKSISTQFSKLNDLIKIKCQKIKKIELIKKKTIWLIKLTLIFFLKNCVSNLIIKNHQNCA